MTIKLVITDIDGTILNDQHHLDSGLKKAVKKLKKMDIPFILASARAPSGMIELLKMLNILDFPLVSFNGALIGHWKIDQFYPLIEHPLAKKELKLILDFVTTQHPNLSINLYTSNDWRVETFDSWAQKEAEIVKTLPIIGKFPDLPAHKLLLIGDVNEIQNTLLGLKKLVLTRTSFNLSKPNYLEITSCACSKKTALEEIAKYYQLHPSEILAFGDHYNDLEMLKAAGCGIAMGNAPQPVKNEVDYITTSNNENGVSKALTTYLFEK